MLQVRLHSMYSRASSLLSKKFDGLLLVLPSRLGLITNLHNPPGEAEAALASVAALDTGSSPDTVARVEVIDRAREPVVALELQLGIVSNGEAIVKSWASGLSRVGLGELEGVSSAARNIRSRGNSDLQLTGELARGLVTLGDIHLLATWDGGGQTECSLAVQVSEDGLVVVDYTNC